MSNKLLISIYSHDDEFIGLLYDSSRSFEGQLDSPQRTISRNGTQSLTFEIPVRIFDKRANDFVENPKWDYIIHQYKIRVEQDGEINEFVCNGYTESRSESNQVFVQVNCISLAEFELSQIGYTITFDENTLNIYNAGDDPNDADTEPCDFAEGTIQFWEDKIIEYLNTGKISTNVQGVTPTLTGDWSYNVIAYHYPDGNSPVISEENEREDNKFYENDRIIGYNYDGNAISTPIYGDKYEEKKRIVSCENSNIWNIQQDICETFECWPTFKYIYEDGVLVGRTIELRNELPDNGNFAIKYRKNLKSISREVDTSQIITKMYVTPIENENMDSGLVSIADNAQNEIGEEYILDLSWYMNEDGTCENEDGLTNKQLIDPNLSYDFEEFEYDPANTNTAKNTTAEVYRFYRRELSALNKTIEAKALIENEAKEEYTNAVEERALIQDEIDSYAETINDAEEEMELCKQQYEGSSYLTYEGASFFINSVDGMKVVKIGKEGVYKDTLDKNIGEVESSDLRGCSFSGDVIEYEIYEIDSVTSSIKSICLKNVTIDKNASYAYFTMDLDYDPLNSHNRLIKHYEGLVEEKENRKTALGTDEMEYVEADGEDNPIIPTLKHKLEEARAIRMAKQEKKAKLTADIEKLLSPFVREGYWENSDYTMYQNADETEIIKNNGDTSGSCTMNFELETDTTSGEPYAWQDASISTTCFEIPNLEISIVNQTDGDYGSITEKQYLYDLADWSTLEVYTNGNPNNIEDEGKLIRKVKGTDYEVHYGVINGYKDIEGTAYTTKIENLKTDKTIAANTSKGGVFLTFPTYAENQNTVWDVDSSTTVYFSVKPYGSDRPIVFSKSSGKAETFTEAGVRALGDGENLLAYCDYDREIVISAANVILSSVQLKANMKTITYDKATNLCSFANKVLDLTYGSGYTTVKRTDGTTVAVVSLVNDFTTGSAPILSINGRDNVTIANRTTNYEITYKTDASGGKYYKDAIESMKNYKQPRVSYTAGIQDISKAFSYNGSLSQLKPVVGTRVAIWDEEMHFKGLEGLIDSITEDLLDPQNTQIEITSYKNKFEELFQKITAATVAVETKEYNYDRAAELTNAVNGTQKTLDLMSNALLEANAALSFSPNNDIVLDESGITVTNQEENENGVLGKLRITSNGLFVSNEKDSNDNYIWSTAITPDFINADLIRAGHLDTRSISIWDETQPRFFWNEKGLNAYGTYSSTMANLIGKTEYVGKTDEGTYVRYNDKGLTFRKLNKYDGSVTFTYKDGSDNGDNIYDGNAVKFETTLENSKNYFYYFVIQTPYQETIPKIKIACGLGKNTNSYTEKDFYVIKDSVDNTISRYELVIKGWISTEDSGEQKFALNGYAKYKSSQNDGEELLIANHLIGTLDPDISAIYSDVNAQYWTDSLVNAINNGAIVEPGSMSLTNLGYYSDSVKLDWDGFRIYSAENKVNLNNGGLYVGNGNENDGGAYVKLGRIDGLEGVDRDVSYGVYGTNSENKPVFILNEDGLVVSTDLSGSNIYGGTINIGGFYKSKAKDPQNAGYNFQVDELGHVKARSIDLYPRAGVCDESLYIACEDYQGEYTPAIEYKEDSIIKYNTSFYKVKETFSSTAETWSSLVETLIEDEKIEAITLDSTEVDGNYKFEKDKLQVYDGDKSKWVKQAYQVYNCAGYYNAYETFSYNEKVYIANSSFTASSFDADLSANKFREMDEIQIYKEGTLYKKGDKVLKDSTYYKVNTDFTDTTVWSSNVTELEKGYGQSSEVEKDRPFAKIIKTSYNDAAMVFYSNSLAANANKAQSEIAHFGTDKISLIFNNNNISNSLLIDKDQMCFNYDSGQLKFTDDFMQYSFNDNNVIQKFSNEGILQNICFEGSEGENAFSKCYEADDYRFKNIKASDLIAKGVMQYFNKKGWFMGYAFDNSEWDKTNITHALDWSDGSVSWSRAIFEVKVYDAMEENSGMERRFSLYSMPQAQQYSSGKYVFTENDLTTARLSLELLDNQWEDHYVDNDETTYNKLFGGVYFETPNYGCGDFKEIYIGHIGEESSPFSLLTSMDRQNCFKNIVHNENFYNAWKYQTYEPDSNPIEDIFGIMSQGYQQFIIGGSYNWDCPDVLVSDKFGLQISTDGAIFFANDPDYVSDSMNVYKTFPSLKFLISRETDFYQLFAVEESGIFFSNDKLKVITSENALSDTASDNYDEFKGAPSVSQLRSKYDSTTGKWTIEAKCWRYYTDDNGDGQIGGGDWVSIQGGTSGTGTVVSSLWTQGDGAIYYGDDITTNRVKVTAGKLHASDYLGTCGYITADKYIAVSYTGTEPTSDSTGLFTSSITFSNNQTITGFDTSTMTIDTNGIVSANVNAVAVFG